MRRRFKILHRVPSVVSASVRFGEFGQLISAIEWNPYNAIIFEIGLCYSRTNMVPDLDDTVIKSEYLIPYSTVFGSVPNFYLDSSYTYYFRMYVRNVVGYAWSDVMVLNPDEEVNLATISTVDPFNIYSGSAKSGGIIANDGGGAITAKGVCWNTTGMPTTDDSTSNEGAGTADFESNLTPLNPSTTYYVRAYATNSAGTAYGQEETLTTAAATLPTVILYDATNIETDRIRLWGRIVDNGGSVITSKGFVWNLTGNPTQTSNFNSGGSGDADFNVLITGLPSVVIIYMRAVAQNSLGWALGQIVEVALRAEGYPPTVETLPVLDIRPNYGGGYGNVTDSGSGTVSERGFVKSITSVNPTPTKGGVGVSVNIVPGTTGEYSSQLAALTCGENYSVRAYAINEYGISYGGVVAFTTTNIYLTVFEIIQTSQSSCGDNDLTVNNTYEEAVLMKYRILNCSGVSYQAFSARAEGIVEGYKLYQYTPGCGAAIYSSFRLVVYLSVLRIIHIDANGIIDLVE